MNNLMIPYGHNSTGLPVQHNQANGMDHLAAYNAQMRSINEARKHTCNIMIQNAVDDARIQLASTACHYLTPFRDNLSASIHEHIDCDIIKIARAIGSGTQHNVYSIALMMLTAFTAATRGRVRIKCSDSWVEPTNLNLIVTAPSGTMKSAVVSRLRTPFEMFADNKNEQYVEAKHNQRIRNKTRHMHLNEAEKALKNRLRKENLSPQETYKIMQENEEQINQNLPHEQNIYKTLSLFNKFTPAGLFRHLGEQGGACASITAEGDFLTSMLINSAADPMLFNNLHDSEPVTKITGRNTRYDFTHASLSSVNFIQPAVLKKLIKKYKHNDIGVLERFIVFHDSHTIIQIVSPIDDISYYNATMHRLLKLYYTQDPEAKQYDVHLTNEALKYVLIFQPYWQHTSETKSAFNKLRGLIIRLAWAIHVWHHEVPHQHPIALHSIQMAVAFMEYLYPHIEYLHSNTGLQAHENAKKVFEKIISIQIAGDVPIAQGWINSRTLQQRSRIKADAMPHALAILEKLNLIKIIDAGRVSNIVVPHPCIKSYNFQ